MSAPPSYEKSQAAYPGDGDDDGGGGIRLKEKCSFKILLDRRDMSITRVEGSTRLLLSSMEEDSMEDSMEHRTDLQ